MKKSADTMCFACGEDNPISLKLKYHSVGINQVETKFVPEAEHQSYDGIMHGGLVTTLLDETMAKAITFKGLKAYTAEIKVRFKHQVQIGKELTITGQIEKRKSRLIFTRADIKNKEGEILAKSDGKFMIVEE